MGYSNDFIQVNDKYVFKNYSSALMCLFYGLVILSLLLLPIPIFQIIDFLRNKEYRGLFYSISFLLLLCSVISFLVFYTKKIIIDDKAKKIIFKYGLFPFIKIKKLDIDKIKEISINNIQNVVIGSDQFKESIYMSFVGIISVLFSSAKYTSSVHYTEEVYKKKMDKTYKKKTYMVDLIDKDQYSYTISTSEIYNEDLVIYANKIGKIINKEVNDQNTIEGFKNIYKKNII
jgi:hypothetical protein